jgi:branched-chain amino acid aminotransferase
MKVSERPLSIKEVVQAAQNGKLQEAFGTGTAAVISPVGEIYYQNKNYVVAGGKMGELSLKLYNEIIAIQYAEKEDRYRWREKVVL